MTSRTDRPREHRRIHASRYPIHQSILDHPHGKTTACLEVGQQPVLVVVAHRRIVVTTVNAAKVHVDTVRIRFAGPVKDKRRNLELRATAKATRISVRKRRPTCRHRIRIHPHGIVQRHHRIQPDRIAIRNSCTLHALGIVVIHAESLLEEHTPIFCMLVIRALVPSAGVLFPVERERAHLYRIVLVEHEHRRRHVVPRAQQTHNLGFGRVELQINGTQAGARIEPSLVNARREKLQGLHLRTLLEIRMLRPFVAAAQNLKVRHLRTPLRRAHQRVVERVMTPEAVFPFGAHRSRLIQNVVPDRDVESAVAVARVVAPRMVNMQHARIIEARPKRAYCR